MTSSLHVPTDAVEGLTVADVMHTTFATLPADATIADACAWFAAGKSRRLALLVDAQLRYMGALTVEAARGAEADADRPAVEHAEYGDTLGPDQPAAVGHATVLRSGVRRVPVVDDAGRLVGVLALTIDGTRFACGRP
jgi:CBS domain-containing protein